MTYVHIDTPFESCESCGFMEIEKMYYHSDGEPVDVVFWCKYRRICENAAKLYKLDQYHDDDQDEDHDE